MHSPHQRKRCSDVRVYGLQSVGMPTIRVRINLLLIFFLSAPRLFPHIGLPATHRSYHETGELYAEVDREWEGSSFYCTSREVRSLMGYSTSHQTRCVPQFQILLNFFRRMPNIEQIPALVTRNYPRGQFTCHKGSSSLLNIAHVKRL